MNLDNFKQFEIKNANTILGGDRIAVLSTKNSSFEQLVAAFLLDVVLDAVDD